MIIKKGYAVQMSFDVPDAEKRVAEKASECFEELVGLLRVANRHLDIIYEPFKKLQGYDPNTVVKYRRVFRRYRNQIRTNYIDVLKKANQCVMLMSEFSTDTKTTDMMNSFISNLDDVRRQVNRLLPLFLSLDSDTFKDGILKAIDGVKKQTSQFKQLINDRVLEHIDSNILAKNWTSNITDQYQNRIYEKLPLVVELFNERQKALRGN